VNGRMIPGRVQGQEWGLHPDRHDHFPWVWHDGSKSRVNFPWNCCAPVMEIKRESMRSACLICAAVPHQQSGNPAAGRSGRQAVLADQAAWQAHPGTGFGISALKVAPRSTQIATRGRGFGAASKAHGLLGDTVIVSRRCRPVSMSPARINAGSSAERLVHKLTPSPRSTASPSSNNL